MGVSTSHKRLAVTPPLALPHTTNQEVPRNVPNSVHKDEVVHKDKMHKDEMHKDEMHKDEVVHKDEMHKDEMGVWTRPPPVLSSSIRVV